MVLGFFGLTSKNAPEYRKALFKQIHEIVFHGNGGYSWEEIYNMPRWLRLFTFKEIENYYKQQQQDLEKAKSSSNSTSLIGPDGKINKAKFPTKSNYK